jgi:hypothetical protein
MAIKYAVVHGGAAHRDEFLAVGLALAHGLVDMVTPIYRRDPTKEELEDKEVLVIDVGASHDPLRSNFDHHQFPREARECALTLMAKFLHEKTMGLTYNELWQNEPWYRFTALLDCMGPAQVAKELGLQQLPEELWSPIEAAVIESMQDSVVSDGAKTVAKLVVERLIRSAVEFRQQMQWLQGNVRWVPMHGFHALWAECSKPMGFNKVRENSGLDVPLSVSFDDRGPGMCLFRFNDDPRLDFSKLSGHPEVLFAHKSGFLVKTNRRMTEEEVIALVGLAIV